MIFILAAGEQKRWGDKPLKQLLPLGATTIIERTIQMSWGIVVSHKQEITDACNHVFLIPNKHRFTCETILSTRMLWTTQTTILLGDTIYSHNLMNIVLADKSVFRVFGNKWEIFALSFNINLVEYLERVVRKAELGKGKGTLRNLFWEYTSTDKDTDTAHEYFTIVDQFNDYTNDVDSPKEYENFMRQHYNTLRIDDGRMQKD